MKFKKIFEKYDKDQDETKVHFFVVLPKDYKPVRVSCNIKINKIAYKDLNKEIRLFWKTGLGGKQKPEKRNRRKVFSIECRRNK